MEATVGTTGDMFEFREFSFWKTQSDNSVSLALPFDLTRACKGLMGGFPMGGCVPKLNSFPFDPSSGLSLMTSVMLGTVCSEVSMLTGVLNDSCSPREFNFPGNGPPGRERYSQLLGLLLDSYWKLFLVCEAMPELASGLSIQF